MAPTKNAPLAPTTQGLLDLIEGDPLAIRKALAHPSVVAALNEIGVAFDAKQVCVLHASGATAKTATGVGVTLCGRKGVRHPIVTCRDCLKTQTEG